jgi:hypothetical protein
VALPVYISYFTLRVNEDGSNFDVSRYLWPRLPDGRSAKLEERHLRCAD